MRAMVLEKLGPIESKPLKLRDIEVPQIKKSNDLLIKIDACGVCRSQLHGIEGDWEKYGIPPALPTVPGHEITGTIVKTGPNTKKLKVGQRIGISPLHGSCMSCQYCNVGKEHLCDQAEITGETILGGYAEYITITEDFATPIPDSMKSDYAAPLFCAGITAYKAVKADRKSTRLNSSHT